MIILEGTDGTGKTTLANWLAQDGCGVIHYGRPEGDPIESFVVEAALWGGPRGVLDRSALGTLVWSDMGFHPPVWSPDQARGVARCYASKRAQACILVRPEPDLASELGARGEPVQEALEAQPRFIRLAEQVYYVPVCIVSSQLAHHIIESEDRERWNSTF